MRCVPNIVASQLETILEHVDQVIGIFGINSNQTSRIDLQKNPNQNKKIFLFRPEMSTDCWLVDKIIIAEHIVRTSLLVDCHRQYGPSSITRQENVQSIIR